MTKYDQGRAKVQAEAVKRENRQILWSVIIVLGLFVVGLGMVGLLGGCATVTTTKSETPTKAIGDRATIWGLVRISQMGEDCASEQEALKRTIADLFVSQGVPRPQSVEVRPLSGSSYCGFAQGVADPIGTPDYGARNTAVVETTLYWSVITKTDLKKAQAFLADMRPIPAPRKIGAKLR